MYSDILVATDGSESSTAAVEQAIEIADPHGATVHFLHAIDVGTEMSSAGVGTIADELTETLTREAERALDDAATRAKEAGVDHERVLLEGVPHESIAEYSADNDADIVVLGASGTTGLKAHLLGSTTDRVVRGVDTSVLVARP